jgi:hypothetical protein
MDAYEEAQQYSPLDSTSKVDYLEFQMTPPESSDKINMIENDLSDRLMNSKCKTEMLNSFNGIDSHSNRNIENTGVGLYDKEINTKNNYKNNENSVGFNSIDNDIDGRYMYI